MTNGIFFSILLLLCSLGGLYSIMGLILPQLNLKIEAKLRGKPFNAELTDKEKNIARLRYFFFMLLFSFLIAFFGGN